MKNKIVVESQEILELGISTKAFKAEDVILVDDQWKRIKKPTDGKRRSFILWAKDDEFDTVPTEAKIVSSHIYSGDFVCSEAHSVWRGTL
jgi:hypothetical protein